MFHPSSPTKMVPLKSSVMAESQRVRTGRFLRSLLERTLSSSSEPGSSRRCLAPAEFLRASIREGRLSGCLLLPQQPTLTDPAGHCTTFPSLPCTWDGRRSRQDTSGASPMKPLGIPLGSFPCSCQAKRRVMSEAMATCVPARFQHAKATLTPICSAIL